MRAQVFNVLSLLIALLLTSFPVTCWTAAPAQPEATHGLDRYKRVGPPPAAPPAAKTIPNVVGKKADAAQAELKSAGFTVKIGKATTTNDANRYNTVHDQDPDGGITAAPGSVVTLMVLIPPVGGPQVTVPNLIEKTANDAATVLKAAGFTGRATKAQVIDPNAHGRVVSQSPPAGTAIPLNVYVDYQVGEMSAAPVPPPAAKTIPNVVGKRFEVAHAELKNAGFTVNTGKSTITHDAAKYHTVHDQEPDGGKSAAPGSVVMLFMLTPPPVDVKGVPNLIGKSANDAAAALKAAGLTSRAAKTQVTDRNAHGHVVSQSPPAGTAIPLNVTVDYQVGEMASAPVPPVAAVEKARVPDIVGRDSSVAMNVLSAAGLKMQVTRTEPLLGINDRRSGQIAHQEPARDTEVNKGSTVNVRVFGAGESAGGGPVTPVAPVEKTRVPDIVGRDSAAAMNILMAAGLQMKVSGIEQLGGISDRRSGQIAHQEPSRSTEVNKGTTVNVRVFGQR